MEARGLSTYEIIMRYKQQHTKEQWQIGLSESMNASCLTAVAQIDDELLKSNPMGKNDVPINSVENQVIKNDTKEKSSRDDGGQDHHNAKLEDEQKTSIGKKIKEEDIQGEVQLDDTGCDAVSTEVVDHALHIQTVIPKLESTVNVGGQHYTIDIEVLEKLLKNVERIEQANGEIFIDRNGRLFSYVLDYLLTGALTIPPKFLHYKQLSAEAQYFGLPGLAGKIEQRRTRKQSRFVSVVELSTFMRRQSNTPGQSVKRTHYLTTAGHVATCKEVFGNLLCMRRQSYFDDENRYSHRMCINTSKCELAFQMLEQKGFHLVSSNTNDCRMNAILPLFSAPSGQWDHFTHYVFLNT